VNDLKERYGIVLPSVTEPIDTASPMGGMIFAILASFAAEERRVITGRTLAGKKEKASRGGFAGGAAPLGYKRDLRGGLAIDDSESAIVQQIVRLCCKDFEDRVRVRAVPERVDIGQRTRPKRRSM
jgi:site-specific DNA recombinase